MIYLTLFVTFLKIGAFTFGGGYAMLPMVRQQVLEHAWLTAEEIVNFIAVSESTPGPFAVNMSTYVGFKTAGFLGAFSATLGVILPSFIIILVVAKIFDIFKKSKLVKGTMSGLKPAVVGLIATAVITTGQSAIIFTKVITTELIMSIVVLLIMVGCLYKKLHPIIMIVLAAVLGIVIHMII